MSKKNKIKYYVVWVGQNPGIYDNWKDCQLQVAGFPNAQYKSFKSLEAAQLAFNESAKEHIIKQKGPRKSKPTYLDFAEEIIADSISVDAACSSSTKLMEYQGVDTMTKEEIFKMGPFQGGTNNVGEFLALVHALAYLKKNNDTQKVVYSDSRTAMAWVRNKFVKTTMKQTASNKILFDLIKRGESWLKNNDYKTKILKWDTERWGEIPADFGRK